MQNGTQPSNPAPGQPYRKMNGCLSTWLWLIIILNVMGVVATAMAPSLGQDIEMPGWYLPVAGVCTVCVVICALALLKWKVWGFWGLVAMEGVSVLINIAESGNYWSILTGAMGVAILVMLLNMGGKDKAWNYLE